MTLFECPPELELRGGGVLHIRQQEAPTTLLCSLNASTILQQQQQNVPNFGAAVNTKSHSLMSDQLVPGVYGL